MDVSLVPAKRIDRSTAAAPRSFAGALFEGAAVESLSCAVTMLDACVDVP